MEDLSRPFDPDQTHQRHFDCVCDRDYVKYLVKGKLEVLAQEQDTVFVSQDMALHDSEGRPFNGRVCGVRAGKASYRENFPLEIQFLATTSQQRKGIDVCSFYPVYDNGAEMEVKLTAIHEWTNGMEATLEGTILGGTREVVFFDTRYAVRKFGYRIGETYKFKLAAFAYCAELLDNPKMKLTAEQAEEFAQKTGCKVRRDANGKAKPMSFDMRNLVACVSRGGAQPDNCEFQSSIRGMEENHAIKDCIVFKIACARSDDDKDVEIPLIARQDFFKRPWPRVGKCLRGILWMQGYCVSSADEQVSEAEPEELKSCGEPYMLMSKIVSDGNSGVARGAIRAAKDFLFPYGGMTPKGRASADGAVPQEFDQLIESEDDDRLRCLQWNVEHSDATLIVSRCDERHPDRASALVGGAKFAYELASKHGKPCIGVFKAEDPNVVKSIVDWLGRVKDKRALAHGVTLNIAGPSETEMPGIQESTTVLIRNLIVALKIEAKGNL